MEMSFYDILEQEYLTYSDNELANIIRDRIKNLSSVERRLFLIFIELGSRRKFAKYFDISHSMANYVIKKIIKKIRC